MFRFIVSRKKFSILKKTIIEHSLFSFEDVHCSCNFVILYCQRALNDHPLSSSPPQSFHVAGPISQMEPVRFLPQKYSPIEPIGLGVITITDSCFRVFRDRRAKHREMVFSVRVSFFGCKQMIKRPDGHFSQAISIP